MKPSIIEINASSCLKMDTPPNLKRATAETASDLRSIAQAPDVRDLSRLSLPEIEKVVDITAQIIPAGNVPGMILSGLTRIPGRHLPPQTIQQHLGILFKSIEQMMDSVAYGALFAGPAAVIWGYQNLLRLAGKDPDSAFPEGTWQFYVGYALREDTARHVNETHGFDTLLKQHGIHLSEVDRLTSWVMAAIASLHQYDELLEVEWHERVATSILREVTQALPEAAEFERIHRAWEHQRPYRREAGAARYDYPSYRHVKFDRFLEEAMRNLPASIRKSWEEKLRAATERDLPAYQKQMSILAYLDPGPYGEARVSIPLEAAQVGLIYHNNYYLIPAYTADQTVPDAASIREQIAALQLLSAQTHSSLAPLTQVRRSSLPELRRKLNPALAKDLEKLRFAPILINADARPASLPLTELRQAERGVGDHALTIFYTGKTFAFDQSHIFFDGILGAALAEIMTNEALSWAVYLNTLPSARPAAKLAVTPLDLPIQPADQELIAQAPHVTQEAGAEGEGINLKACNTLRRLFKQRNSQLKLTINDLLVLYRAIHAAKYQPSPALQIELEAFAKASRSARSIASAIRKTLDEGRSNNPSMLIPIDASRKSPRERLYPLCLEVPLMELDLLNLHQKVMKSLDAYETASGDRTKIYAEFDRDQRQYLATLAGFGSILNKWKEIAVQGESASVGAIKLLAHMPPALQRLLDKVPEQFETLNNILKGREVFSNVGAVVPTSTLTRFITAKDDNEQKQLVWGVLTDAQGVMHLSLRDFRPHVATLHSVGRHDLARHIAQDYLEAYIRGFNTFIRDLQRITLASRKTRMMEQRD